MMIQLLTALRLDRYFYKKFQFTNLSSVVLLTLIIIIINIIIIIKHYNVLLLTDLDIPESLEPMQTFDYAHGANPGPAIFKDNWRKPFDTGKYMTFKHRFLPIQSSANYRALLYFEVTFLFYHTK